MKKDDHVYLKIPKDSFRKASLAKIFLDNLNLPKHEFPPRFLVAKENFFCGGYFVCYNKTVSIEEIIAACRQHNWQFLMNMVADFLIIYCDFIKRELFILIDSVGKFPCYFSTADNQLVFSTEFGLVKDELSSCTLDLGVAFDYLSGVCFLIPGERTIISEIKQILPGTLLMVDENLSCSLTSLVDIGSFLNFRPKTYRSVKKFADDFVLFLGQLISEQLGVLGSLPFAADLSSGFDSPLVCYLLKKHSRNPFTCHTMVSEHIAEDTIPEVVREFCQKHELKSKFFPIDEFCPLSEFDLSWIKERFYPATHAIELERRILETVSREARAIFQGIGGDEIYGSVFIEQTARFPVQLGYFDAVTSVLKWHVDEIITPKGIEILLDKKRHTTKGYHPLLVSPTATMAVRSYFPHYWEMGVWPMTPYIDPRLVQFARGMPHRGEKFPDKREIWQHRSDIFLPKQFRSKGNFSGFIKLFVSRRKEFILSALQNSILAEKGWVKAREIFNDFQRGNEEKYLADFVPLHLMFLLQLEYFLQQNNIKVPDY